jgi:raffinose/stachyose/melibiose transport system substrate-binding protein
MRKRPTITSQRPGARARYRRVSAALVALGLVVTAAACSSSTGNNGASGGKVTISIWNDALASGSCGVPASKSFLTQGVALFEKTKPGFNVKIVQEACDASTAFNTLLKSSEVAGTTPDIGQLYVGGQVIENGKYLVPLNNQLGTSYINSLTGWKFVTNGYGTTPNGSIYGVPFGAGYWYMVYYNKKLMAKAHITNPDPANWNQLLALGKKVKAAGVTPFDIGEKEGYMGAWTQDALISGDVGDAGVLSAYSGKSSLNSSLLTKPYAAWHQLYADGLTNSNAVSLSYATAIADFAAGQAAMTITGGFYDSQFTKGLGNNVSMFPVPVLPGAAYPHSLSGGPNNSYVVFKTSAHVADDVKLIKFLTTLPVQELSVNELGQLPNNVSFSPSAAFQKAQPLLTTIYQYLLVKHYTPNEAFDNIMPGSIDSYWYQTNNGVFGGTLSPSSAAGSMQSQMTSYLASASAG